MIVGSPSRHSSTIGWFLRPVKGVVISIPQTNALWGKHLSRFCTAKHPGASRSVCPFVSLEPCLAPSLEILSAIHTAYLHSSPCDSTTGLHSRMIAVLSCTAWQEETLTGCSECKTLWLALLQDEAHFPMRQCLLQSGSPHWLPVKFESIYKMTEASDTTRSWAFWVICCASIIWNSLSHTFSRHLLTLSQKTFLCGLAYPT